MGVSPSEEQGLSSSKGLRKSLSGEVRGEAAYPAQRLGHREVGTCLLELELMVDTGRRAWCQD